MKHLLTITVSFLLGLSSVLASSPAPGRALSFEERLAARRAVEEVRWSHRIWPKANPGPKPALDAVLPDSALRAMVQDDLRKSNLLATVRHQPITTQELQAEVTRMVSETRAPAVLRELFDALGNDPVLIAETLARPYLAEHRLREQFDGGPSGYDGWWQQARESVGDRIDALSPVSLPELSFAPAPTCASDTWTSTSQAVGVPVGRYYHTGIWTGSEMIVWGGQDNGANALASGARYDPSLNQWFTLLASPLTARYHHTAVYTGTEMIVWGGNGNSGNGLADGARYNVSSPGWTLTAVGAPAARTLHSAVWSGTEMIVWGGSVNSSTGAALNTGGRYTPGGAWVATTTTLAPLARRAHTAVWDDLNGHMIVWGGETSPVASYFADGKAYDPASGWITIASFFNYPGRSYHTAVWTGTSMIIWGGWTGNPSVVFNTGGVYDAINDAWTPTDTSTAPNGRFSHVAVVHGCEMVVWGGWNGSTMDNTGGRYNFNSDAWTPTLLTGAPVGRQFPSGVWADTEMIVWGGADSVARNDGGRLCLASPTWCPDGDLDGHGNLGQAVQTCDGLPPGVIGWTSVCDDCNDANATIYPGAPELCDGLDNNCNNQIDEGLVTPGEVPLYLANAPDKITISWPATANATKYQMVRSDWNQLEFGIDNAKTSEQCLPPAGTAGLSLPDATPAVIGNPFCYLVRAVSSTCPGTYGQGFVYSPGLAKPPGFISRATTTCP